MTHKASKSSSNPEPSAKKPATSEPAAEAEAAPQPVAEAPAAETDPTKRAYREALERKKAGHGAGNSGHGDTGGGAHAATHGQTQRMFRRKSGG